MRLAVLALLIPMFACQANPPQAPKATPESPETPDVAAPRSPKLPSPELVALAFDWSGVERDHTARHTFRLETSDLPGMEGLNRKDPTTYALEVRPVEDHLRVQVRGDAKSALYDFYVSPTGAVLDASAVAKLLARVAPDASKKEGHGASPGSASQVPFLWYHLVDFWKGKKLTLGHTESPEGTQLIPLNLPTGGLTPNLVLDSLRYGVHDRGPCSDRAGAPECVTLKMAYSVNVAAMEEIMKMHKNSVGLAYVKASWRVRAQPRTLIPHRVEVDVNIGVTQPGKDKPMHLSLTSMIELGE